MTKRDFFIFFIKITGLFLLLSNVFTALPALFSYGSFIAGWQIVLLSVAVVLIVIGLFIILVQKADRLVDWLNLTKGFDDDRIELGNPNKTTMMQ